MVSCQRWKCSLTLKLVEMNERPGSSMTHQFWWDPSWCRTWAAGCLGSEWLCEAGRQCWSQPPLAPSHLNRKGVPHSLVHNQSRINWVGECTPSHTQADEFTPKLHKSWWIHTKNCTWPDLFTPKLHLHRWTHTQNAQVDKFTPKLCMNWRIHTQTAHELMNSHSNCTWTGDFTHKLHELINSHPNCTWSDEFMPKVHMYWWIYNQTAHEPINSHPKRSWTD